MDKNDIDNIDSIIKQYQTANNLKTKKRLKDFIVLTYLPVVKSIARSIARRCTDPVEDIIQIGSIGLIKAIDLYKPMPTKHFKSYAKIFITGEIKHYLRDNTELIRSSRAMKELSYKINKMTTELTEKLGHAPSDEELSEALQLPMEKITEFAGQDRRTTILSLDNSSDNSEDNAYSLVERIEDESAKRTILSYENRQLLDEIICELPPVEQDLLTSYYYDELTHTELSLRYNVPQSSVAPKLKHALDFIVKKLEEKGISNLEE